MHRHKQNKHETKRKNKTQTKQTEHKQQKQQNNKSESPTQPKQTRTAQPTRTTAKQAAARKQDTQPSTLHNKQTLSETSKTKTKRTANIPTQHKQT